MPMDKEPTQIQDRRESYNYNTVSWYTRIPLAMMFDKDINKTDIKIYSAIDFLAGERGWWYGKQDEIFQFLFDRFAQTEIVFSSTDRSNKTIRRSIKKLREKNYIVTQRMGMRMNHILKYFIIARKPDLPPRHLRG